MSSFASFSAIAGLLLLFWLVFSIIGGYSHVLDQQPSYGRLVLWSNSSGLDDHSAGSIHPTAC